MNVYISLFSASLLVNSSFQPQFTKLDQYRLTTNPLLPQPDCVNVIKGDQDRMEESALLNLELRSAVSLCVNEKTLK